MAEHVDLILNGHEHNYQRGKQLALDATAGPSMTPGTYIAGCITDDGTDGVYPKGVGTTNVVVGTFGQSLYRVDPNDARRSAVTDIARYPFVAASIFEK